MSVSRSSFVWHHQKSSTHTSIPFYRDIEFTSKWWQLWWLRWNAVVASLWKQWMKRGTEPSEQIGLWLRAPPGPPPPFVPLWAKALVSTHKSCLVIHILLCWRLFTCPFFQESSYSSEHTGKIMLLIPGCGMIYTGRGSCQNFSLSCKNSKCACLLWTEHLPA